MSTREQRIQVIAYHLWEREGRPHGHSDRLWLAAEAQYEADLIGGEKREADPAEQRADPKSEKPARSETPNPPELAAPAPATAARAKAAGPSSRTKPPRSAPGKKAPVAATEAVSETVSEKPQPAAKRKPKAR